MFFNKKKQEDKNLSIIFTINSDIPKIEIKNYDCKSNADQQKLSSFLYSLNKGLYIRDIVRYLLDASKMDSDNANCFVNVIIDWENLLQIDSNKPMIKPIDTFSHNAKQHL